MSKRDLFREVSICQEYADGKKTHEIMHDHQTSATTVYRTLHRHGIARNKDFSKRVKRVDGEMIIRNFEIQALRGAGVPIKRIASRYGLSDKVIRTVAARTR